MNDSESRDSRDDRTLPYNFATPSPKDVLSETSLGALHDLGYRLQNAVVIQRAQRHALAPAHLLQHVAPFILLAELRNRGAHNFSVPERDCFVTPTTSRRASRRLSPLALEVGAVKVFAIDAQRRLVDMDGCVVKPSGRIPNSAVGSVKHGAACITLSDGLGLDVELARKLVENLACVLVKRREVETSGC
jgi:hypothetical protein